MRRFTSTYYNTSVGYPPPIKIFIFILLFDDCIYVGEIYQHLPWYKMFGLNSGQWHRLDNIFTIVCFSALCFYFMENKRCAKDRKSNGGKERVEGVEGG